MSISQRRALAYPLLAVAAVLAVPAGAQSVDEIIVTARKRQENLTEVPLAINAWSEEDFEKRNIADLNDVAAFTPGLAYESYAGGITPAPVIRGLSQTALQSRIQNVGIFIDGVYIQQQGNVDFGLLGIERVEVVKGPQSALYGRNSFAGAINYVTKKPSEELEAQISITRGTDEREDLKASISGAIIPGILAARVSAGTTEFDGTYANNFRAVNANNGQVYTDQAVSFLQGRGTDGNLGGYDNKAQSASVLFTPIDRLEFELGVYNMEIRRDDGPVGTLEQTTDPNAVGQLNCNPRAPSNTNFFYCGELDFDTSLIARDPRNIGLYADTRIWTAGVTYRFTDNLSAKYLYGRTNLDAYSYGVGSGVTPIQTTGTVSIAEQPNNSLESDSHELRLEWEGDRLTVLGGVYTTKVEDTNTFFSYNVATLASGGGIVVPPGGPFAGDGIFPIADEAFEDDIDSVFAAADYRLTDDLTLGVEARYTREKKFYEDRTAIARGTPGGQIRRANETFNYFSPRVSLDWQMNDRTLIYGSVAQGEKAGGFNSATADPGFETYDEETNITYEIGNKVTLLDGRAQLNTALFYIKWDDLQISFADVVPANPGTLEPSFIGNGKGADSYGFEGDLVWSLTDNLTANLAYSYTNSEYANGVTDAGLGSTCNPDLCNVVQIPVQGGGTQLASDIGGNSLSRSPEHQAAFGLEYAGAIPGSRFTYTARGDLIYQDEMYGDALNLSTVEDRLLLNANFILGDDSARWNLNFWAKNLTDEEYIANTIVTGNPRRYITQFGEGRTLGVTLNFNL